MQKVYSLDADTISKARQEMETIYLEYQGWFGKRNLKEYIKVLDLAGLDMVMPRIRNPSNIYQEIPVVSYMSAELKPIMEDHPERACNWNEDNYQLQEKKYKVE